MSSISSVVQTVPSCVFLMIAEGSGSRASSQSMSSDARTQRRASSAASEAASMRYEPYGEVKLNHKKVNDAQTTYLSICKAVLAFT